MGLWALKMVNSRLTARPRGLGLKETYTRVRENNSFEMGRGEKSDIRGIVFWQDIQRPRNTGFGKTQTTWTRRELFAL